MVTGKNQSKKLGWKGNTEGREKRQGEKCMQSDRGHHNAVGRKGRTRKGGYKQRKNGQEVKGRGGEGRKKNEVQREEKKQEKKRKRRGWIRKYVRMRKRENKEEEWGEEEGERERKRKWHK